MTGYELSIAHGKEIQRRVNTFREIASRVDTCNGNDSLERALIVFHHRESTAPVQGWVTFSVEMPWRMTRALPQINVRRFVDGVGCDVFVTEPRFKHLVGDPEVDGAPNTIQFAMQWSIIPVQPSGWDAYIASYSSDVAPHRNLIVAPPAEALAAYYTIIETLRHPGDLPPCFPAKKHA